MKDKPLKPFNIPLDGKLMTGVEPGLVGKNFRKLQNMRYVEHGLNPQGIGGMGKINTTALTYTV